MEGEGEKKDKKDDREEREIRKGGKERWCCVCCFQSTIKRTGQLVAED